MPINSQFDSYEFRKTLGTFATGVTIVTTRAADGTAVGLTVNSFNSVSLDPPLVLWSLAKKSGSLPVFETADYWAVHVLSVGQEELAIRFARNGEDKFSGLTIQDGPEKMPLLTGCAARLQCKTSFRYEGGDHIILVGEVVHFERSNLPPLVFHGGKYMVAVEKADSIAQARNKTLDPETNFDKDILGTTFDRDFLGYLLWRAHCQFRNAIRECLAGFGLNHADFFILATLFHRDGRSRQYLDEAVAYTGHEPDPGHTQGLVERGWLKAEGEGDSSTFYITERGRDAALHVFAAVKAMEFDLLDTLGYWETVSLKNLLQRFILHTNSY